MKIKDDHKKSGLENLIVSFLMLFKNNKLLVLMSFMLMFTLVFGAGCFFIGAYSYQSSVLKTTLVPVVKKMDSSIGSYLDSFSYVAKYNYKIPVNYFKSLFASPKVLNISMKHKNYLKLVYLVRKDVVNLSDFDSVPGNIEYADNRVKIRLNISNEELEKNDTENEKWPLIVEVDGEKPFMGMKRFSLLHPNRRNFLYEIIFNQLLKKEGVVSLKYEFIRLILNGKDLGVYALEEIPSSKFVGYSGEKDGPIIKYEKGRFQSGHFDSPFRKTRKRQFSKQFFIKYQKARVLLEHFMKGKITAEEAFDVEKLAKFYAVKDMLGSKNSSELYFYINPSTLKIEPIGVCGDVGHKISDTKDNDRLKERLFKDVAFFSEYVRFLKKTYKKDYFKKYEKSIVKARNVLYREFPHVDFSEKIFSYNQKKMLDRISNPKIVASYSKLIDSKFIELNVENSSNHPIEIVGMQYKRRRFILDQSEVLRKKDKKIKFDFPISSWKNEMIFNISILFKVPGEEVIRKEPILPNINSVVL